MLAWCPLRSGAGFDQGKEYNLIFGLPNLSSNTKQVVDRVVNDMAVDGGLGYARALVRY